MGAHLEGAILQGTNLQGANLFQCNLASANLSHATLSDAQIRYADLSNANLSYAIASNSSLEGAFMTATNLANANFDGADFAIANIMRSSMEGTSMQGAKFFGAHLELSMMRNSHFEGADFRQAHLEAADLGSSNCDGANFFAAHLQWLDQYKVPLLRAANLMNAHLSCAFDDAALLDSAVVDKLFWDGNKRVDSLLATANSTITSINEDGSTRTEPFRLTSPCPENFSPSESIIGISSEQRIQMLPSIACKNKYIAAGIISQSEFLFSTPTKKKLLNLMCAQCYPVLIEAYKQWPKIFKFYDF